MMLEALSDNELKKKLKRERAKKERVWERRSFKGHNQRLTNLHSQARGHGHRKG